ncbi:GroES-like protein [Hyaloscypha variabilis]
MAILEAKQNVVKQLQDLRGLNDELNPAFVLQKPLNVSFEDRPIPTLSLGSTDVIVQIMQTGICGSDVHYYNHGSIGKFIVESPMILGHESSGVVAAVGSACKNLHVGDRVALEPGVPCRQCSACKGGKYNMCPSMVFAATPPFDGTLCKYYKIAEDFCYKLPPHISFEEGALIEPLSVAVHICRQASIVPGNSVVVFGAGPVGILCCAVARAFGAKTIVSVDLVQSRLAFAQDFYGATHTHLAGTTTSSVETAAQLINDAHLGDGADVVIEASGAASSVQTGIHVLRSGGRYVQCGMGKYDITFPIGAIIEKELDIKGSFRYGSGDYLLAISLLESRKIDMKRLITGRYKFHDAERAFKDVYSGKPGLVKVVIEGPEGKCVSEF